MATRVKLVDHVINLPVPSDLFSKQYPKDIEDRFNESIEDFSALVAYMLKHVGLQYSDCVTEAAWDAEKSSLLRCAYEAWTYLEEFRPLDALDFLSQALELLGKPVPQWWLDQLDCVPYDEEFEPVKVSSWWWKTGIPVIEDELPPWEVSQTAA